MGKLTAEQKVREYNRGQKAAREGRSRSWSEPWAYPFESNQHYEERREAFNQGYGIIDATPMSVRRSPPYPGADSGVVEDEAHDRLAFLAPGDRGGGAPRARRF